MVGDYERQSILVWRIIGAQSEAIRIFHLEIQIGINKGYFILNFVNYMCL